MSRARERYICASEDRPHYNTEDDYFMEYRYPGPPPNVVTFVQEKIIKEEISEEKLNELIEARISQLKDDIIDQVNDSVATTEVIDAAIDEIYGGSASDVLDGGNGE